MSEEENLPTGEEMRARYAHLLDDDAQPAAAAPAAAELADEGAVGSEQGAEEVADEAASAVEPAPEPDPEPEPVPEPEPIPTPDTQHPTPDPQTEDSSDDLAGHLLDVKVRFWAELGRAKLPLAEAVSLGTGAIVDLDKEPDAPLDVFVNGTLFAKGRLLLVDGEWAVRLEQIVKGEPAVEQLSSAGSEA